MLKVDIVIACLALLQCCYFSTSLNQKVWLWSQPASLIDWLYCIVVASGLCAYKSAKTFLILWLGGRVQIMQSKSFFPAIIILVSLSWWYVSSRGVVIWPEVLLQAIMVLFLVALTLSSIGVKNQKEEANHIVFQLFFTAVLMTLHFPTLITYVSHVLEP